MNIIVTMDEWMLLMEQHVRTCCCESYLILRNDPYSDETVKTAYNGRDTELKQGS